MATGCGGTSARSAAAAQPEAALQAAAFSADSALAYLDRQLAFGPRTPGSEANRRCGDWIITSLRAAGADSVIVQEVVSVPARNILGRFRGSAPGPRRKVLLLAHYDTRPWADQDPDPANHNKPVPGANDGASGVAVLLETARQLSLQRPAVDVDLLFVDNEDSGISDGSTESSDTWARGTQAWIQELPYGADEPAPAYAILLDMVGGKGARFHREYYSEQLAPALLDRVWAVARSLGMSARFPDSPGGAVVDDHLWVNRAGIPAIDIIESQNPATGSFPAHWHTLADDRSAIDPATLETVGKLVNTVIRNENPK